MIKNETSYELGSPFLSNVEVKGKILENKKDKKVIVFKKEEDTILGEKTDTVKTFYSSDRGNIC